ncbi:MAG: PhnD/SsuA/transferrin family substrate-binding protein [Sphaerochaetaceae bacterium]|nr:PhnD/SsuA/transferrin family substrate-binding protein [Sphaerochaetaceae bacterium]
MKKLLVILLVVALALTSLVAKGAQEANTKKMDDLTIMFVPSRDIDLIKTQTDALCSLLKDQLAKRGFEVGEVKISVGSDYNAVGEAMGAGTCDMGFIPAGTYVTYRDVSNVILTATREAKDRDSEDPMVWNDGEVFNDPNKVANGYRSLIYCDITTAKGKALYDKVAKGEKFTWDELAACNWGVSSTTSSAGYIYPSIWLYRQFDGKTVADLPHAVQAGGYAAAFAGIAAGQYDIIVCYAEGRQDYAKKWQAEFGRKDTIWNEMKVIGVTDMIVNDTISVRKDMSADLQAALQDSMIEIANTPEGKDIIAIYNHTGYVKAVDSDYDSAALAQEIFKK